MTAVDRGRKTEKDGKAGTPPPKKARPVLSLVLALCFVAFGVPMLVLGAQSLVEQWHIESAEPCAGDTPPDCVRLVSGVLDGPVSGGPGHRTWQLADHGQVVEYVDVSTWKSKKIEDLVPERAVVGVWHGETVWVDTSAGRFPDTFHTYALAGAMTFAGLLGLHGAAMFVWNSRAQRRRSGSWWAKAEVRAGDERPPGRGGELFIAGLLLCFSGTFALGLSESLWALVAPPLVSVIYLWQKAASRSAEWATVNG